MNLKNHKSNLRVVAKPIVAKPVNKKDKGMHKPDPKRVAAAKLAWSRGPKLLKIKAKAQEKRRNAKLSKKAIAALPKTIKAVEKKMAKAA